MNITAMEIVLLYCGIGFMWYIGSVLVAHKERLRGKSAKVVSDIRISGFVFGFAWLPFLCLALAVLLSEVLEAAFRHRG